MLPRLEMATIKPPTMDDAKQAIDLAERAIDFTALRETMRGLIGEVEADEDKLLGKREGKNFYEADASFEPERNKLVKTSDVIVALNLIAAHFIVRTWPGYLKTKIEEWIVSRVAGAAGVLAGMSLALKFTKAFLQRTIGAFVGAFAVKVTQEAEMRGLEKTIRKNSTAVRRELNEAALSQKPKPVRIGPTYTRNGNPG